MSSAISDPRVFVALLITAGIIFAALIFFLYRKKLKSIRNAAAVSHAANQHAGERRPQEAPIQAETPRPEAPKFTTLQKRSGFWPDLLRAFLIVLGLAVAAALVLTLLPQPAVDTIAEFLESRHGTARPERIAFLYLGDRVIDNQFRILGAVKNIAVSPIEQMDAVVRFYAQDRSLLETIIVRMDKETIGPNEIARFELVYPNDRPGFAGYSAEFKLRRGETVPYKDLRRLPAQSK